MMKYGLFGKIAVNSAEKQNTKKHKKLTAPTERPLPKPEKPSEWWRLRDFVQWNKDAGIEERTRKAIESKAHEREIIEPKGAPLGNSNNR